LTLLLFCFSLPFTFHSSSSFNNSNLY
jgi:hypothetical protein